MRALRPALTALGAVLILMGLLWVGQGMGWVRLARVELHDRPAHLGHQRRGDGRGRYRLGDRGPAALIE